MWNKYSSNLSWALMPWILNKFKRAHCQRALTMLGSFPATKSSSLCSLSLHYNILMVKSCSGDIRRKSTSLFHILGNFYWLNMRKKFGVSPTTGRFFLQCGTFTGELKPTCGNLSFPQGLTYATCISSCVHLPA
jgi:hypothetical protein